MAFTGPQVDMICNGVCVAWNAYYMFCCIPHGLHRAAGMYDMQWCMCDMMWCVCHIERVLYVLLHTLAFTTPQVCMT